MLPCHALAAHPHSFCRNRHCPKCQGAAARHWLAEREAELLPVGYFHLVFTLPGPIADIAYQNKRVIYELLFKASAQTMLIVAADPKHLGARLGITAVLHTWGSAMTHHPHVHMIVPSGGLSADESRWIASRPRFLLCRACPLDASSAASSSRSCSRPMPQAVSSSSATHRALADGTAFGAFSSRCARPSGSSTPRSPSAGRRRCSPISSRYTHRVAISNRRLIEADAERCHLQMQGLPLRWTWPVQDDDAARPTSSSAAS